MGEYRVCVEWGNIEWMSITKQCSLPSNDKNSWVNVLDNTKNIHQRSSKLWLMWSFLKEPGSMCEDHLPPLFVHTFWLRNKLSRFKAYFEARSLFLHFSSSSIFHSLMHNNLLVFPLKIHFTKVVCVCTSYVWKNHPKKKRNTSGPHRILWD